MTRTLAGYTDRISACPGDTIAFKISAEDGSSSFRASLVRLHCLDSHRDGPGFQEERVAAAFDGEHPARRQPILIGSRAVVEGGQAVSGLADVSLAMMIWPTLEKSSDQCLVSIAQGLNLSLGAGNRLTLGFPNGATLTLPRPLLLREWVLVTATYDAAAGRAVLAATPRNIHAGCCPPQSVSTVVGQGLAAGGGGTLAMAARLDACGRPADLYNGKIDSPRLFAGVLAEAELRRAIVEPLAPDLADRLVAAWDFSLEMSTERILDISPNRLDGRLFQMPGRAAKGWNWSGRCHDWKSSTLR